VAKAKKEDKKAEIMKGGDNMAKKSTKKEDKKAEIKLDNQVIINKIHEIVLDEIKENDTNEIKEDKIEVIDTKGKVINEDTKDDFIAPIGFVPARPNLKVNEYGCYKGRTYQVISKNVAVWCDNGTQFSLSDLNN
jgi:hypothetical protein